MRELASNLFEKYVYITPEFKIAKSSVFFSLDNILSSESLNVQEDLFIVVRGLFHIWPAVSRINSRITPIPFPGLSQLLELPTINISILVNDILRNEIDIGKNRVLVYRQDAKKFYVGKPSSHTELGLEWGFIRGYSTPKTLLGQFEQIAEAVLRAQPKQQEPSLNSEGHPGPIAAFGGD